MAGRPPGGPSRPPNDNLLDLDDFTPVYSSGQRPHINDDELLREYEADHAPAQSRPSVSYDDFVGGTAGTSSTHGLPGGPRGPSAEQQPYTHSEINRTYSQTSGLGNYQRYSDAEFPEDDRSMHG